VKRNIARRAKLPQGDGQWLAAPNAAWGEWEGPGKQKQLGFRTLFSDSWTTYCMRNRREVAKIIGPRTFTINQALRRDAEWAYAEIRRIMRAP
jgi:hypothetical protein